MVEQREMGEERTTVMVPTSFGAGFRGLVGSSSAVGTSASFRSARLAQSSKPRLGKQNTTSLAALFTSALGIYNLTHWFSVVRGNRFNFEVCVCGELPLYQGAS